MENFNAKLKPNARTRYFKEDDNWVDLRRSPKSERTFRVKELWEIHHEIVRRLALGERNRDIAKSLGLSEAMVSYTKNSGLIEEKVGIMRGAMDADTIDLGIRIQKIAPRALELLEEVMNKGTVLNKEVSAPKIITTAERHMDRAGYAPVKRVAIASTHLTPEDIENIKDRARLSGVIDIIPNEVSNASNS